MENNYSLLQLKCPSCNEETHEIQDCPILTYKPSRDTLINKMLLSTKQKRELFIRRKYKVKSALIYRQQLKNVYFKLVEREESELEKNNVKFSFNSFNQNLGRTQTFKDRSGNDNIMLQKPDIQFLITNLGQFQQKKNSSQNDSKSESQTFQQGISIKSPLENIAEESSRDMSNSNSNDSSSEENSPCQDGSPSVKQQKQKFISFQKEEDQTQQQEEEDIDQGQYIFTRNYEKKILNQDYSKAITLEQKEQPDKLQDVEQTRSRNKSMYSKTFSSQNMQNSNMMINNSPQTITNTNTTTDQYSNQLSINQRNSYSLFSGLSIIEKKNIKRASIQKLSSISGLILPPNFDVSAKTRRSKSEKKKKMTSRSPKKNKRFFRKNSISSQSDISDNDQDNNNDSDSDSMSDSSSGVSQVSDINSLIQTNPNPTYFNQEMKFIANKQNKYLFEKLQQFQNFFPNNNIDNVILTINKLNMQKKILNQRNVKKKTFIYSYLYQKELIKRTPIHNKKCKKKALSEAKVTPEKVSNMKDIKAQKKKELYLKKQPKKTISSSSTTKQTKQQQSTPIQKKPLSPQSKNNKLQQKQTILLEYSSLNSNKKENQRIKKFSFSQIITQFEQDPNQQLLGMFRINNSRFCKPNGKTKKIKIRFLFQQIVNKIILQMKTKRYNQKKQKANEKVEEKRNQVINKSDNIINIKKQISLNLEEIRGREKQKKLTSFLEQKFPGIKRKKKDKNWTTIHIEKKLKEKRNRPKTFQDEKEDVSSNKSFQEQLKRARTYAQINKLKFEFKRFSTEQHDSSDHSNSNNSQTPTNKKSSFSYEKSNSLKKYKKRYQDDNDINQDEQGTEFKQIAKTQTLPSPKTKQLKHYDFDEAINHPHLILEKIQEEEVEKNNNSNAQDKSNSESQQYSFDQQLNLRERDDNKKKTSFFGVESSEKSFQKNLSNLSNHTQNNKKEQKFSFDCSDGMLLNIDSSKIINNDEYQDKKSNPSQKNSKKSSVSQKSQKNSRQSNGMYTSSEKTPKKLSIQ